MNRKSNLFRMLMIGDIVGKPGRRALDELLPDLIKKHKIDFVIANGENSAGGLGITPKTANSIFSAGVHVITSGNHIYKHKEINSTLIKNHRILRPANYPDDCPGHGYTLIEVDRFRVAVVNLEGRIFMNDIGQVNPFKKMDALLPDILPQTPLIFVDFHAEATSEKIAMGHFLDGRVTGMFGTHTHVQTADDKILPKGTAFLSDVGMTGPDESVIGVTIKAAVTRFSTESRVKFTTARGKSRLDGCLVEADSVTGRAFSIQRIQVFTQI